jgi:long-chain acyl-CoA synthetase
MLGGNIRMMITGSAPISEDVLDFLKIAFCCDIIEGYGMTESSAGSVLRFYGDSSPGHCGGPIMNVKVKLRDIPEMGYLSSNDPPKGEICMKGSSIMKGYYLNPEKTAEALSEDGWLYSGDVGMILPSGAIKIIDRAKNIFKLSQGEYIAPEKLENVYVTSPYIAQVWIYGDSLRDHIIGFFIVDPENTKKYAEANGKTFNDELLSDKDFRQTVFDDLMKLAVDNKFNSLEKPKQFMMFKDPWSEQNEFLTPTFKMKRNIAQQKYKEQIAELYASPDMKPTKK